MVSRMFITSSHVRKLFCQNLAEQTTQICVTQVQTKLVDFLAIKHSDYICKMWKWGRLENYVNLHDVIYILIIIALTM